MATSKGNETRDNEQYKLLLELWQKERASSRNEFTGFIIATAILILVSLGGAWWAPILGLIFAIIWLVLSARTASQQERLYSEMDAISAANSDNPALKLHGFEQDDVKLLFVIIPAGLIKKISGYILTGTPALFIVIWIIGFIVALVTTIVT